MARVLCIEDEEDIRQTIAEELSDAGYEVFEASNGQLGLESILCQTPDLVLCDVNMPVMGGHDLLRELRAKHPELADMPFIFLSALADRGYIVEGKRLGADDYLTKPIDFELLLATVESRLNQVQRMTAHKEEQFVKIYRSFNEHPAESQCGPAPARNGAGSADASRSRSRRINWYSVERFQIRPDTSVRWTAFSPRYRNTAPSRPTMRYCSPCTAVEPMRPVNRSSTW